MSDIALEFNDVWKKFKRGEKFHSLRDLIPAMTKRLFLGNHQCRVTGTRILGSARGFLSG